MTLEQALQNVEQALASLQANKQVHQTLDQCMHVIREALQPKEETKQ